jgi:hypothetical protein
MILCVPLISALIAQLEALQLATDDVTGALNAWGDTLVAHLQDIPMRAREVALHGVRHGSFQDFKTGFLQPSLTD